MRRFLQIVTGLAAVALLCGCSTDYFMPPVAMTPTPTPILTMAPEPAGEKDITIAVTATPVPTEKPAATPTPTPITTEALVAAMRNGGTNAKAEFGPDGKVVSYPEIEADAVIYANNFEKEFGNWPAEGDTFAQAVTEVSDRMAYNGRNSVRVSQRKETTWGLSGAGISLSDVNGLSYEDLTGHTLEIVCRIYYCDEGFGAAESITFALYDAYHTETVQVPRRTKSNDIELDWQGNPVMTAERRSRLCDTCVAQRDTWNECRFNVTIDKAEKADGMLFIGTTEEEQNSVGAYVSYYIDNLYITVIE